MDIEQIQCVIATAREASFSKAAASLRMSQSSVSKKVAQAERELDTTLFKRSTRNVTPTDACRIFLRHGEEIIRQHTLMTKKIRASQAREKSRIVIGSIYFAPSQSIAPYVALYALDHPEIEIETVYGTTSPLTRDLLEGNVDVAVVSSMYAMRSTHENTASQNFSSDDRFLSASLARDPYYLVVSAFHRFADRKIVDYCDIRNEKIITLDKNMDVYHRAINQAFEMEGIVPNIALKSGSIQEALTLVSQNVGVAIFSTKAASGVEGVRLIEMRNPLLRDTQILIRNEKNIAPPIRSFFKFMKESYR